MRIEEGRDKYRASQNLWMSPGRDSTVPGTRNSKVPGTRYLKGKSTKKVGWRYLVEVGRLTSSGRSRWILEDTHNGERARDRER